MAEKPRLLTVVAEIAAVVSTFFTIYLVYIARHPPSFNPTDHAQGGGLVDTSILLGAIILGGCTIIASILNFVTRRSAKIPISASTSISPPLDPYAGVLTPLQLDTFSLAKRMRDFYAEIKSDWSATQVMHGYASRFNSDLTSIMHRLGAANVEVGFLEVYTRAITNSPSILDAARLLEKLALTLNEATVS